MKKAIEDGGGNGAIAVEDSGPLFEGFVGGDDDRTASTRHRRVRDQPPTAEITEVIL